jgi:hypothetical protein
MRAGSAIAVLYCVAVAGSISGSAQSSSTLQPPSACRALTRPFYRGGQGAHAPRCMNCYPATDRLLQGNDKHPHEPVATRQTPCVTSPESCQLMGIQNDNPDRSALQGRGTCRS